MTETVSQSTNEKLLDLLRGVGTAQQIAHVSKICGGKVLGLVGVRKEHFAFLDKVLAREGPFAFVRVDFKCNDGIEWALGSGLPIVMDEIQFEYQRNTVSGFTDSDKDEFVRMVVGMPTRPEDYATPEVEFDVCNRTDINMPITHRRVSTRQIDEDEGVSTPVPLVGDLMPDQVSGRWIGPICDVVFGPFGKNFPRVEGMKVIQAW